MKKKILSAISILTAIPMVSLAKSSGRSDFIKVNQLNNIGIDQVLITELFKEQELIDLDPSELLKVEQDEEGNNVKVETLDKYSIDIPIQLASGNLNKIGQ